MALLTPPGDPIGYGYLALAVVGYFFIQTRGLTTFLWLLVAAGGLVVGSAGNASGWVEFGIGVALAVVALTPLPPEFGGKPARARSSGKGEDCPPSTRSTDKGLGVDSFQSSGKVEVSPIRTSAKAEVGAPDAEKATIQAADGARLVGPTARKPRIRAIGRLQIEIRGRDVTERLREQPRLEFLLSYLLARSIGGMDFRVPRAGLGEEIAPDLPVSSQRARLRNQLYELRASLGSELRDLVQVNNSHVSLDLHDVDIDATDLQLKSLMVSRSHALIDVLLADEIRRLLDETGGGEFLSGFSELDHQVTAGRGGALQTVVETRSLVAGWRADLVHSLAEYYQAAGRPQASIAYLQASLAESQQREDLARLLVAAYIQTGQTSNADQIRREYHLIKENMR
jgi:DNA-binding SARP family transcriptional activator